jgi:hypothetical protein
VLADALGAADPRRRMAALVVLDDAGVRPATAHLVERAGEETDPWVTDALAGVVHRRRAALRRTAAGVDLLLWATRRLDGRPGPLPPDPEVDTIAADLRAALAVAARRGRPAPGPGLVVLVGLFLLVQLLAERLPSEPTSPRPQGVISFMERAEP